MPSRAFRDEAGAEWQVWSVIAGWRHDAERRRGYDRRSPDPVFRYAGAERRTGSERREGSRLLDSEYRMGWLVFDSGTERRRLAPIPPGWERMSDAALARLCRAAAPRTRP